MHPTEEDLFIQLPEIKNTVARSTNLQLKIPRKSDDSGAVNSKHFMV